jgi:hypothetical protein
VLRFTRLWDRKRPSACSHGPSDRDVARCIDVGVATVTTVDATEDRLALAVLGADVTTFGAGLRRVRRTNLLDAPRCLVLQTCDEASPPGAENGPTRGLGHALDPQILHANNVELTGQVGAGLLEPVLATVGLARHETRNGGPEPLFASRSSRRSSMSPKAFIAIAFSSCWMAMRPGEVVALSLGKVTQGLLLHHRGASGQPIAGYTCSGELARLFEVARRGCSTGSPAIVLLHREVPDKPGVGAAHLKSLVLRPSRVQAKAHGEKHGEKLDRDHRRNGVMTDRSHRSRTGQRGTMNESERIGRIRPWGVG